MKRILLGLLVIGLFSAFFPFKIKAWYNNDHPFIVDQAAIILENDFSVLTEQYPDFQEYIERYLPKIKQGAIDADAFSTTVSNEVVTIRFLGRTYTVYMPTTEHFYDYKSGYGAFRYFRSARQKAEEYYNTAKVKFEQEDYDNAFLFLGRAVHMVQDVTMPQHTEIGYKAILNVEGYSNWNHNNRDNYKVTSGGLYNLANIGAYVHENALLCNGNLKYIDGLNPWWIFRIYTPDDYKRASNVCFKRAQQTTAGVIAKFLSEVFPEPEPVKEIKNKVQKLD